MKYEKVYRSMIDLDIPHNHKNVVREMTKKAVGSGNNGNHHHHWSYNFEHAADVILIQAKEHRRLHKFIVYHDDSKFFRRRDTMELLDTKEKHLQLMEHLKILPPFPVEEMKPAPVLPIYIEKIIARRRALKLTQEDVAQRIGFSHRSVSAIECGHIPSWKFMVAICDELGLLIKLEDGNQ